MRFYDFGRLALLILFRGTIEPGYFESEDKERLVLERLKAEIHLVTVFLAACDLMHWGTRIAATLRTFNSSF